MYPDFVPPTGEKVQYTTSLASPEDLSARPQAIDPEAERVSAYKNWIQRRKMMNEAAEKQGMSLEYLWRKTDRTELEEKMMVQLWKERYPPLDQRSVSLQ